MINLLTNKQKKIVHRTRLLRVWTAISIGTISLISISLILFFPTFLVINNKYAEAKENEKKIETSFSITPESVDMLTKKVSQTSLLFSGAEGGSTLAFLDILEEKNTPGIVLSRVQNPSRAKKTLDVSGIASTRSVLRQYESRLRSDPRIERVDSPVSNYVKTQNAVFVLTIVFK